HTDDSVFCFLSLHDALPIWLDFPEFVCGQLIRRYKRFFVDVKLDDGQVVTAHCANSGSMKSILDPPPRCWLSRARPGRKLAFTRSEEHTSELQSRENLVCRL